MHILVTFTIFTILPDLLCAQTREFSSAQEVQTVTVGKKTIKDDSDRESPDGNRLKSFWIYRPSIHQPIEGQEYKGYRMVSRSAPQTVTRLAKSLTLGFDPYFHKGYFEPFERRRKPVTLVAFRKKGLLPRNNIIVSDVNSSEIAELQSPYNDIPDLFL